MVDPAIELRPLGAADLTVVSQWFHDPDTRRFLGGPEWPRQALARGKSAVGTTFRGALAEPALDRVEIVGAGVDPENAASLATLRALSFTPQNPEPDWEGMLYLLLDRRIQRLS